MWPIYVISLTDQTERRKQISAALHALDLPFTFIDAVDGRNGLDPRFEKLIDRKKTLRHLRRPMSDGEYACALSHMSVYERIVSNGLEGAIVLEDDAAPGALFVPFLRDEGYRAADLVQMDHMRAFVWGGKSRPLTSGVLGYQLAYNSPLATGYSVSRRAASYLLSKGRPIYSYADWPCDMTRIDSVACWPRLVTSADTNRTNSALESARGDLGRNKAERRLGDWPRWFRKKLVRKFATRLGAQEA